MSAADLAATGWDVCTPAPVYDAAEACVLAKNLARNCGYRVFPARPDKRPACPHGFHDASADADTIDALWRRYPGPLVGVATGAPSGLAVLDIDVRHPEALAWWRQHQRRLPATRTYRTRSGGLHLYYRHAEGIRCATARPVPGIDVRGDGGYVITWYAAGLPCLDHAPAAEWPAWLTREIWPAPAPKVPSAGQHDPRSDAAVTGVIRTVREAREGGRNGALYWAAHRMRERGSSRSSVEADLVAAATAAGLPEIEARRTIASAWRTS